MRTESEIFATARDEPPFANGTEIFAWMENWCYRCHHPIELAWRKYEAGGRKTQPKGYPGGCPLIRAAMLGKTPTEFLEQPTFILGDQYHCIEYRGPDGGGDPQPRPRRDPPNMDALFDRPPPTCRMLKQPQSQQQPVNA